MNSQWMLKCLCEKNKEENGGGKLKESLLNTLDKFFPFDWKY